MKTKIFSVSMAIRVLRLTLVILSSILAGHAAIAGDLTAEAKRRVQADLKGKCLELFLLDDQKSTIFKSGYQNAATGVNAVFAVGEFNSKQYCAWATKTIWNSWGEAEKKAIDACERVPSYGGRPCEVYARNNDIVYLAIHDRLRSARKLIEAGDIPAAERTLNEVRVRNLSKLKLSAEETGQYEYLFGKVLINSPTDENIAEAIAHFHNSWTHYKNVNAAVEEANAQMMAGAIEKNWQSIRDAYQYFLANASDEQKSLHPEAEKNLKQTEQYFQADLAQKEEAAKEQARLDTIREMEQKEQARIDAINAKREAQQQAKQEQLYAIKAKREAQQQEKIRQAEAKRQAKEGDGSPDDTTCKSYGARPGSDGYINCRIQLGRTKQLMDEQQVAQKAASNATAQKAADDAASRKVASDAEAQRAASNLAAQKAAADLRAQQQAEDKSNDGALLLLMGVMSGAAAYQQGKAQAYQPAPMPAYQPPINIDCTSTSFGNTVRTNCR